MDNSPITIFTNTEFGNVRTHTDENGTLWFVARDVANILGYHNTKKAIIDHVDDDEKMDGVTIRDTMGRPQRPVFINESGVFSLILGSKLPQAKRFKRWITSEVLPSIRKHGGYMVVRDDESVDDLIARTMLMPRGLWARERIYRRSSSNRYEPVRIAQTKNVRCRNKRGGTTRLNPQRTFTKTSLKFEFTFMSNF